MVEQTEQNMNDSRENDTEHNNKLDPTSPEEFNVDEFREAYGEDLTDTINLDTWPLGQDLAKQYARLAEEVRNAVQDEQKISSTVRKEVFPKIEEADKAPNAGLHCFDIKMIEKCHKGFLFNGGVEACDGISVVHDTLPLSITQIGVCLVSYNGQQGSFVHRLYRRDLRLKGKDPVKEALEMLERRSGRESVGIEDSRAALSSLARRGIMAYAERAILLEKSNANWLMGHGSPLPYELMTGFWASRPEMTDSALTLMSNMVLNHQKFVYVPSAPRKRDLLTLGNALLPMEYLILYTLEDDLTERIDFGGYRGEIRKKVEEFTHEVGSKVAVGLFRVSSLSPPYLFYAHVDHVQTAALIAMSDAALQLHRGFPMLIDIADHLCKTTFGQKDFLSSVQQAYTETGNPTQFMGERETR
ncbi:hypothetical protein QQ020_06125 [Fulvivirgaceae bacterium BMA12]|uniref:NurA domain-containing protein n=1 Tax=Agaribacillus aureus TaxID=3051825 RepID=A0ABT8L3M9_9BACT|nr:hypothetical protein [Fulvivirgaceae bacterium BMA12]